MYINIATSNEYPELCWFNCEKFDTLTQARKYASGYRNMKIYRVYFYSDTGDLKSVKQF